MTIDTAHWVWLERDEKDMYIGPYSTESDAVRAMEHALLIEGECQEDATDCATFYGSPDPAISDVVLIDPDDPDHTGVSA